MADSQSISIKYVIVLSNRVISIADKGRLFTLAKVVVDFENLDPDSVQPLR